MLHTYTINGINAQNPWEPGDELAAVVGLFGAKLQAIEIARTSLRPVMVWELRTVAKLERVGGKIGERRWIRFYSAGAPRVTKSNERTIQRLAALEASIRRAELTDTVEAMAKVVAELAAKVELPEVADRLNAIVADVSPVTTERKQEAATASAALTSAHWPREAREEPTITIAFDGEAIPA